MSDGVRPVVSVPIFPILSSYPLFARSNHSVSNLSPSNQLLPRSFGSAPHLLPCVPVLLSVSHPFKSAVFIDVSLPPAHLATFVIIPHAFAIIPRAFAIISLRHWHLVLYTTPFTVLAVALAILLAISYTRPAEQDLKPRQFPNSPHTDGVGHFNWGEPTDWGREVDRVSPTLVAMDKGDPMWEDDAE